MKMLSRIILLAMCIFSAWSCSNTAQTKQDLKQIGANIVEATAITAAETALAEAQAKLNELKTTPIPAGASFAETFARSLAIGAAQSLVDMAQSRLAKLKASNAPVVDKNPVIVYR